MIRARVGTRFADRWRLALALLLPTLGGMLYLRAFDAPARLIAVNAGALVLGAAWVLLGRLPDGTRARLGLAASALGGLFLPLLLQFDVEGVSRWLPVWPFALHSGALLLPLLSVLAAGAPRAGPWFLALAALALALQPDAGTLAALAMASTALAWVLRSKAYALAAGASLTLALATWEASMLAPQTYTEGVLAQVWQSSPAPAALLAHAGHAPRAERAALAALLAGLGAVAIVGPYPFPLIGYGAAPILGFALALGAVSRGRSRRPGEVTEVVDRRR